MKDTSDPIVAEIRAIREARAKRFGYDLDAMFEDLRAKEAASGHKFVRLPPRRPDGASESVRSKPPTQDEPE